MKNFNMKKSINLLAATITIAFVCFVAYISNTEYHWLY